MLQNGKCVLFNTVLFKQDCTTWWKVTKYRTFEPWKYVSISFYFEFCFKNCVQNYPTISREHSGKKLLVSTEEILQNRHLKFWISKPHGLQISKFLIFSCDALVVENEENNR